MTMTSTKPKIRAPEDVWYDVHKHPDGTPGGMGRSPEHHLRNRGWHPYEINEGSGKKTIQYRNHGFPDFVVSYGGGTSAKPDHNFRVLYMGTNSNVPKVTRAYSVAEAMNKVEDLHQLQSGLVVQPMVHDSAYSAPSNTRLTLQPRAPGKIRVRQTPAEFGAPRQPARRRDMTEDDQRPIGSWETNFPTAPDEETDWRHQEPQLKEIPDAPSPAPMKRASCVPCRSVLAFRRASGETWEDQIGEVI